VEGDLGSPWNGAQVDDLALAAGPFTDGDRADATSDEFGAKGFAKSGCGGLHHSTAFPVALAMAASILALAASVHHLGSPSRMQSLSASRTISSASSCSRRCSANCL